MQKNNYLVIDAAKKNTLSLKELWQYRELFFFFSWRDIKVRYKQTAIGAGWAIIQPVLATGIFTLFFNKVAGISSGNSHIPYPVFAYLGLLFWNSFSSTLNTVSNSLLSNSGVMTKIYFPRLIPPLSATALSIVDFFFASLFFFVLLVIFGVHPHLLGFVLFIPSLLLIQFAGLSLGIFFAALNVKYRDVRTALPFLVQMMLFATPVIYPATLIPARFQFILSLNPAASAISMVRGGFFGGSIKWISVLISFVVTVLIATLALIYFKKTEKKFVDII